MPVLTFPDGNKRSYDPGVTGKAVAEGISKSLAKSSCPCREAGPAC